MAVDSPEIPATAPASSVVLSAPRKRWVRWLIVLAGMLLGQAVLYGPCLVGRKLLLPLDILACDRTYLPQTPEVSRINVQNPFLSDPVVLFEPMRRFAVNELSAGRLPRWNPCQFAGAPFLGPIFSPLYLLECTTRSPVILAWSCLAGALVAGLGAGLFFRRVLAVGFWPASLCAWCYPLTGYFVFWQGFLTASPVFWLPWSLLAVDRVVRGNHVLAPVGLSAVTSLVLVSGHLDVAGQVLLGSGLFALWSVAEAWRGRYLSRSPRHAVLCLALAWGLGIGLAAPQVLPAVQYACTGARMVRRSVGQEERPPAGLVALPQTVLPDMYGKMSKDNLRFARDNQSESSAAAYAGLLATLWAAPLAWCSRRHRSSNMFWLALALAGLGWTLNLPGLVSFLRLPVLNMMSHNRLVFLTSFAILAMAAVGLEVLAQGPVSRRRWWWGPALVTLGLGGWCVYRAVHLPEPLATQLEKVVSQGRAFGAVHNLAELHRAQASFARDYAVQALLCLLVLGGWCLVWLRLRRLPRLVPALGLALLGDMLWFGYGRSVQSDPALNYPGVPALEQVARAQPGRVIGCQCLPPQLPGLCGLRDVRGYDGVDPARLIELLSLALKPEPSRYAYALTLWVTPYVEPTPQGNVRVSPILDLLGVRYVVFRGSPPPAAHPLFTSPDYWVLLNPAALPRAFVPQRVEVAPDRQVRLQKLGSPQFDPREVAYVESAVSLPASCRGGVEILNETPQRIILAVRMETPGLVVLADRWDAGWQAWLDGKPRPVLPVNHALRGVVVPAGVSRLEFRYQPAAFTWGLWLAGLSVVALLAWTALNLVRGSSRPPPPVGNREKGVNHNVSTSKQ